MSLTPGAHVRVTIDGHISDIYTNDSTIVGIGVTYKAGKNDAPYGCSVNFGSAATVEVLAPVEWPPRAGDLWRDRHRDLWVFYFDRTAGVVYGRTADGVRWARGDDLNNGDHVGDLGPWTLVHREQDDETEAGA